ncbi:DUF2490 domain-containing protein [Belliella kenyensis]|uniref:DUF2490 domain-containing protein n=1 Tax=Belliella kenyensis TaxID=1472724 RepID=A0ABV8ESB3_9BACT|nr:DUF2490 domain-containing protein [Belliella kenyensis]MCH7401943.1 DUF2490 domain-containing protein [Belliella kenyensis]MDN3605107.1 DUF2490 domain-containing protein [Belliella kenyensis]
MNKKIKILIVWFILLSAERVYADGIRLSDFNTIGWYNIHLTHKVNDKWSLHGEFQWRRANLIKESQQNLFRTGVNYQIHPFVLIRAGIGHIETHPYGKVPIQNSSRIFPEFRFFQMVQINNPIDKILLKHRFMLEQRWVGNYSNGQLNKVYNNTYVNRIRYMATLQLPLDKYFLEKNTPYLSVYDEIMIGFGKSINQNIFDQNRVGLVFGLHLNHNFKMEFGGINQILQFARLIEDKALIQTNSGLIFNTYFTF